jgi:hypothetical protein
LKPDHILTCKITGNSRNIRHNKIVEEVVKMMNEDRKASVVCVDNKNMCGVRDKPDIEFYIDNKRYLIDVSFVHDKTKEK